MTYSASWTCFVDGENLDLIEVAERARDYSRNPSCALWTVTDHVRRKVTVVDLEKQTIISETTIPEGLGLQPDGDMVVGMASAKGPDGNPFQVTWSSAAAHLDSDDEGV